MADLDILPRWGLHYLQETIEAHAHIINVLPIDRGTLKGAYLVNTSRGALVLQKSRLGEPQHWLLPLPGQRAPFQCSQCGERLEFVNAQAPRDVYCMGCGCPYLLQRGEAGLELVQQRGKSTPPASEPAADPAPIAAPRRKPDAAAPFKHGAYTLHKRVSDLRGGGTTTLYFFAKNRPKSGEPTAMPDGYAVQVSPRTRLPYLLKTSKPPATKKFQCGAQRSDGLQCRKTAREGSKYCATHKGYQPRSRDGQLRKADTVPARGKDTLPAAGTRTASGLQCAALTGAGAQCKNGSRAGSKYCSRHKTYRPAKGAQSLDTKPAGKGVKDTVPARRR